MVLSDETGTLDRKLCQVVGLNQNYISRSGTLYHIQIEDRGPLLDPVTESEVRRVNVIIYANYGEPNARIIYGRDHDFEDRRTLEHNRFVEQRIQELANAARQDVEEREARQVERIKAALREYYVTKHEAAKRQFAEANALFPFLFSRAWRELKEDRGRPAPEPAPAGPAGVQVAVYPLDPELRESVIQIERAVAELERDIKTLKERGGADDILVQTCRKMVARAQESLSVGAQSEFNARRLELTRTSLVTTLRQVRSRLKGGPSR